MDALHERVYELSSEHIKTINALADKYGRYADSSPDFEKPPVHVIRPDQINVLVVGFPDPSYPESEF